jgi:hypothetical protein
MVAAGPDRPYVTGNDQGIATMSDDVSIRGVTPRRIWPILMATGAVGLLIAATGLLWARYGTAVFFETIRAGFTACFG